MVWLNMVWLIMVGLAVAPAAFAQDVPCDTLLVQAEQQYTFGRFDEAIGLITACVEQQDIEEGEKQQAYRLMGLSYLGKKLTEDAREALRKLIDLVPNYQVDPVQDPPSFAEMITEIQNELQAEAGEQAEEPSLVQRQPENQPPQGESPPIVVQTPESGGGWGKWLLIGGGLVAGGVAAAVLLTGSEGGGGAIAGPPALPTGN